MLLAGVASRGDSTQGSHLYPRRHGARDYNNQKQKGLKSGKLLNQTDAVSAGEGIGSISALKQARSQESLFKPQPTMQSASVKEVDVRKTKEMMAELHQILKTRTSYARVTSMKSSHEESSSS